MDDAGSGRQVLGFNTFHNDNMNRSGARVSSRKNGKPGLIYQQGPYAGMAISEAESIGREMYARLSDAEKLKWEKKSRMEDVMSSRELAARNGTAAAPVKAETPAAYAEAGLRSAGAGRYTDLRAPATGLGAGSTQRTRANPDGSVTSTTFRAPTGENMSTIKDVAGRGASASVVTGANGGSGFAFTGRFEDLNPTQQTAMRKAGYVPKDERKPTPAVAGAPSATPAAGSPNPILAGTRGPGGEFVKPPGAGDLVGVKKGIPQYAMYAGPEPKRNAAKPVS
jgi:hypothetical protein